MFKYSISVYKIYLFPPTIFLTIKAMIFLTCCIRTQPLATWLEVFLPRSPVTSLLQNSMRIFGFYLIWPLCCIWHHDHSILFRNTFFSWIFKSSVLVLPNSRRSFQAYLKDPLLQIFCMLTWNYYLYIDVSSVAPCWISWNVPQTLPNLLLPPCSLPPWAAPPSPSGLNQIS